MASAYLSGGKVLHGLIIALLTRVLIASGPCLATRLLGFLGKSLSIEATYYSGGNHSILPLVCRLGVVNAILFITTLKLTPAFKGKVLVK